MIDRYVIRSSFGSDDFGDLSYVSERGALQHVGRLLDEHGSDLKVEIFFNELARPIWSAKRISDWNNAGRPDLAVYDQ